MNQSDSGPERGRKQRSGAYGPAASGPNGRVPGSNPDGDLHADTDFDPMPGPDSYVGPHPDAEPDPGRDPDNLDPDHPEPDPPFDDILPPETGTAGRSRRIEEPPQPPRAVRVDTGMASTTWNAAAGHLPVGSRTRTGSDPADPSPLANGEGWATGADAHSDAAIMLRVREGDEAAFTYLIEKYHRQIVHFMFRMVHNQAVAEELAQEVFLRVYRSRESYRAEAKFTTWLYRIATNLGVNHARDNKHERAAQTVYLDQPDAETGTTPDVADSRATAEQSMLREERMSAIRQHVMALPDRQRSAVLMHKYQEMDYKQIGEVLKLSESATKSLLFRAYQTLRERLKEYV